MENSYENIQAYLNKNMDGPMERFSVTVRKVEGKEPGLLHLMIHPENRSGETADFMLHTDGMEKHTHSL